jgi:hypothetical protein
VTAQFGNCSALAEVTAVIDTSAAAIRILDRVIVILRVVVVCGEFARAITATLWKTLPGYFFVYNNFVYNNYVGIRPEKAHRVNITLARTALTTALKIGSALRTRWQSIDVKDYLCSRSAHIAPRCRIVDWRAGRISEA